MSRARTYLDWNATAPLCREARAAMVAALDVVGNPSSPHAEGRRTRAIVEDAREQVAALVGAKPAEVVFTGGGSEGDNLAVKGAAWAALDRGDADGVVTTGIEHKAGLVATRVGHLGQRVRETEHEERHCVGAHRDGRIALLRAQVRALRDAHAVGGHCDRQSPFASRERKVTAELRERSANPQGHDRNRS